MPSWSEILSELKASGSNLDILRRKYLARLNNYTKRNVIIYYSGWLQKPEIWRQTPVSFAITDGDKNGIMSTVHKLDRTKGLDLFLHTPGGEIAATESLVDYFRSMFDDVRAVIPQIALSAGTMISLACKEIIMGTHSSLGPIDPQIGGLPAHGILEEFESAAEEIAQQPSKIPLWQPIIAKYNPTLIGECYKAIQWTNQIVKEWLITGMFKGDPEAEAKATKVINELGDHALTLSHSRHISAAKAKELGLKVVSLEEDDKLQDLILSIHHVCIHTFAQSSAVKMMENHKGTAAIASIKVN